MLFFISDAHAQAAGSGGSMISLLLPFLLLPIFYFLMIRPQQKRMKEHKAMVEAPDCRKYGSDGAAERCC